MSFCGLEWALRFSQIPWKPCPLLVPCLRLPTCRAMQRPKLIVYKRQVNIRWRLLILREEDTNARAMMLLSMFASAAGCHDILVIAASLRMLGACVI